MRRLICLSIALTFSSVSAKDYSYKGHLYKQKEEYKSGSAPFVDQVFGIKQDPNSSEPKRKSLTLEIAKRAANGEIIEGTSKTLFYDYKYLNTCKALLPIIKEFNKPSNVPVQLELSVTFFRERTFLEKFTLKKDPVTETQAVVIGDKFVQKYSKKILTKSIECSNDELVRNAMIIHTKNTKHINDSKRDRLKNISDVIQNLSQKKTNTTHSK